MRSAEYPPHPSSTGLEASEHETTGDMRTHSGWHHPPGTQPELRSACRTPVLPEPSGAEGQTTTFNLSSLPQTVSQSIAFLFLFILFIFYEHIFGSHQYLKDCDGRSLPWLLFGNSHIPPPPILQPTDLQHPSPEGVIAPAQRTAVSAASQRGEREDCTPSPLCNAASTAMCIPRQG